jgi:hypothetical protein
MTGAVRKTMKRSLISLVFFLLVLAGPGAHAAESWRDLSAKEREKVLKNYERWQNLPPRDKEHLKEEWDRWRSLPQDRRDKLRKRYDDLQSDEGNRRSRRDRDRD